MTAVVSVKRVVVLASVLLVVGCGVGVWGIFFWSGCSFPGGGQKSCASEVGFDSLDRVEIRDARKEQWLDAAISFELRGSPETIDEVLAAADFSEPLVASPDVSMQVGDDADLGTFSDLRYGMDLWTDGRGREVERQVLRATRSGDESEIVLFVFAFR